MKQILVILAALAACATLFTGSAEAQSVRTFVSGNGIVGVSGGTLNIQNCVIHGFQQSGIDFAPASAANLNVSDTIVANNGGSGIGVFPAGGATTASFVRVQAIGNSIGFNLFTSI